MRTQVGSSELLGLQGQGDTLLPMWFHQGHSISQISPGCFEHRFLTDIQRMESISLCSAWRPGIRTQMVPYRAGQAVPPLRQDGSTHCVRGTRMPVATPTWGASKPCWL